MTLDYFGKLDAGIEAKEKLAEYFYDINRGLKLGDKADGSFLVVGVKGSGKTAICRYVQDSNEAEGIVWKLNIADGWDAPANGKSPIHYQSILTVQLLTGIYRRILENREAYSATAWAALPSAATRFGQKVAKFAEGIMLQVDGGALPLSVEIDIGKLINAPLHKLNALTIDDFREMLTPCLSEVRAYILIDDVDELFPGSQENWDFIDGLIGAVSEINAHFGSVLHCLIFLQAGIYNYYYMHGRGYDKHAAQGAVRLRWSRDELLRMLTRRIAVTESLDATNVAQWKVWQSAFDGKKSDIEAIQGYLVTRSNSGPRDVISFANTAKHYTGDNQKISFDDIRAKEADYSRDKLYLLNRDYERHYGDIATLLFRVFQGQPQVYKQGALENDIQTKMLGSKEIKDAFGNLYLVRLGDARLVMERLFEFGFIGYKTHPNASFQYSMDADVNPGKMLFEAHEHSIHPAYQAYLGLS